MKIKKVISGGQTGADMAGLMAARTVGIETGGWATKGYLTEDGARPGTLKTFGLKESTSQKYPPRTRLNIVDSDCTIIIAEQLDRGSALTREICFQVLRPVFHYRPSEFDDDQSFTELVEWIEARGRTYPDLVINIAGNRESKHPGLERAATGFLKRLFHKINGESLERE